MNAGKDVWDLESPMQKVLAIVQTLKTLAVNQYKDVC